MELLAERSPLSTETAKLEVPNLKGACLRMKPTRSQIRAESQEFPMKELEPASTFKLLEPTNLVLS